MRATVGNLTRRQAYIINFLGESKSLQCVEPETKSLCRLRFSVEALKVKNVAVIIDQHRSPSTISSRPV